METLAELKRIAKEAAKKRQKDEVIDVDQYIKPNNEGSDHKKIWENHSWGTNEGEKTPEN